MKKRLLLGVLQGVILGALLALGAQRVPLLGTHPFADSGFWAAYLFALVAGVLVALVAGRPVWAREGRIEAALKAVFGAIAAMSAMYALRRWGLAEWGSLPWGHQPWTTLPIITTGLALLFQLDHSPEKDAKQLPPGPSARHRVAGSTTARALESAAEAELAASERAASDRAASDRAATRR